MDARATFVRLWARCRRAWLSFLVFAVAAAVLVPAAGTRLIDGDEGFYLVAARLVSEGKRLYADFFYPQMPLLPHLYGGWFTLVGRGWMSARVFTGLVGATVAVLVFVLARRTTGRRDWALVAAFLFLANGMTLGWFTVAKTYALTSLFLMAGALALATPGRWAPALAGLALGCATNVRLYVVVAFLPALVWLLTEPRRARERLARAGLLVAGGAVAALPVLIALVRDSESFWFGVLGFHRIREAGQTTFIGDWPQKIATLLSTLGLQAPDASSGLQMLGLVLLALSALSVRRSSPTAYLWWPLLLISLLPTPTYTQYFAVLVPLLAVEAARFGASLSGASLASAVTLAGALYLTMGIQDGLRFLGGGQNVPGVDSPERAARWSLTTMKRVEQAVDRLPAQEGASWWPGYFVGTRARIIPEMANDFGTRVAARLPPDQRARRHLISHQEVAALIKAKKPPLFLEGNWFYYPVSSGLPGAGYRDLGYVENVRIWLAP